MKLKLRGLNQGEHQYTLCEPSAEYGLDENCFSGEVNSDVLVNVQGKNYYIKIHSYLDALFECDRCLDAFVRPVEADTTVVCTEDPTLDPEQEQVGLHFLPARDDTIDLNEDVRQSIILTLPLKIICDENCRGLCPVCGANRNRETCSCKSKSVDSRWEQLKKLKDKT